MHNIWWNQITKANRFISQISDALQNDKSVILGVTAAMPWFETLFTVVEERMRSCGGNRNLKLIKSTDGDVGEYLLNNYCKRETRNSYRIGVSYAAFLAQCSNTTLNARILWVKEASQEKANEWLAFIDEYNRELPRGVAPALFVVETSGSVCSAAKKYLECISFRDHISSYDRYAFCTLVTTDLGMVPEIKLYLADLVSNICADDVELCAACMKNGSSFLADPVGCLATLVDSGTHDDGSPFIFSVNEKRIADMIWESQIRLIFPAIERYRKDFIVHHRMEIASVLPIESPFGETVAEPEEVEIGVLYYMTAEGRIQMRTNAEFANLRELKEARNKLAHLKPLDFETVKRILTLTE